MNLSVEKHCYQQISHSVRNASFGAIRVVFILPREAFLSECSQVRPVKKLQQNVNEPMCNGINARSLVIFRYFGYIVK